MQHPADEIIARYAQGRLPGAEAARWEAHLSSCHACGKKLADAGSDGFMQLVQQTPLEDSADTLASAKLFPELPPEMRSHGRYQIEKKLGHGGMGMVYQATHRLMHRPVALKMIRADLLATPLAVTRFRREVQAAASLSHPNIVTAHDAEEVAGVHFLVMEYVEGRSLDELVRQKGPLAVPVAISVAKQIAQGLHHAHSLGMIHRDIKPSNVMITRTGKAKILDFGLARWSGRQNEQTLPGITKTGTHLGTLLYAAPEQLQSASEVDARADLYSLGATMVYLLTGKPPAFCLEQAPEPIIWPTDTPEKLRAIVEQLFARDPSERYPSAKAVLEALNTIQEPGTQPESLASTRGLRYALMAAVGLVLILMGLLVERDLRPGKLPHGISPVEATRPEPMETAQGTTTPAPAKTEPVKQQSSLSAKTPTEQSWTSLLENIRPDRDSVAGVWRTSGGELTNYPAAGGRLTIPFQPPSEYDVRIVFTRRQGEHSVGMMLMHDGRQCTFELDAWEQHLAGFQNIHGQSLRSNANVTRRENEALQNNKRYTLVLEVRRRSMRALLDGREVSRYEGDGTGLEVDNKYWEMPANSKLGLLSWQSLTVFHQVEWRPRQE